MTPPRKHRTFSFSNPEAALAAPDHVAKPSHASFDHERPVLTEEGRHEMEQAREHHEERRQRLIQDATMANEHYRSHAVGSSSQAQHEKPSWFKRFFGWCFYKQSS
ncbi:hypothetical protein SAICODRAFT_6990 [Saitoella complicata NRRL Y-17804]|uniref:Uncharacterized protein n=1 Tax=Saitoella complicata (strain BCRC 22490 / CBS 7301 / JCM 7358 / NBRC 10748 / NRRL Y-17804) TaxID=698492 RepID=A0A0E9NMB4_SAICN|nr:uncharacterized protein SAICODRAFT_6990 [Saitoella complicata NRRL Y-17804]ODQ53743.1 hypothetical protein SAICODRAFT_6990 [Saitoella complicata NRRL Y-17804]GAO50928.1 hypothetical protein G7K_5047-t1 [Saitoella complicata NRRL Y-17804]